MVASEIVQKLNAGELTIATAWPMLAQSTGFAESQRPPISDFNIWMLERWSLPMALAWAGFEQCNFGRRCDMVRMRWPDYAERCARLKWDKSEIEPETARRVPLPPFRLEPPPLISLGHDKALSQTSDDFSEEFRAGFEKLWPALVNGQLKATGRRRRDSKQVEIPESEFSGLEPYRSAMRDRAELASLSRDGLPIYDDVSVLSATVENLWPAGVWIDRETQRWTGLVAIDQLPDDRADIPVTLAVAWVATERGKVSFPNDDVARWQPARNEVFARIAGGDLSATGEGADQRRVVIPPHEFSDARFAGDGSTNKSLELLLSNKLLICTEN